MSAAIEVVVDWQAVLNELRTMGIRTGQISMRVHLSSGMLREYRLGLKAPGHANGEKIIAYWMRLTDKSREQIPTKEIIVATATEIASN